MGLEPSAYWRLANLESGRDNWVKVQTVRKAVVKLTNKNTPTFKGQEEQKPMKGRKKNEIQCCRIQERQKQ